MELLGDVNIHLTYVLASDCIFAGGRFSWKLDTGKDSAYSHKNQDYSRISKTRAGGLGEEHANIVLKVLKVVTDAAYTDFLKRKLVGWYATAPKSDHHAPVQENDGEVSEAEDEGEGDAGGAESAGRVSEMPSMDQ